MPEFTVLIPTFDHTQTITRAIHSLRHQTVQDFEVMVVGDGAPPEMDGIMKEICDADARIQYFPHPKDAAHGETYRHAALQEAAGDFVCYLSDDDLWLPSHLETMGDLLKQADFANTLHVAVERDGRISSPGSDPSKKSTRERMLNEKWNCMGLSVAGHTLSAYRRLPQGWNPRPEGMYSDLHMWRQWLVQPWCRIRSGAVPTTLHFASPLRKDMTLRERLDELDDWLQRIQQPGFEYWLSLQILDDWKHRVEPPGFYYNAGNDFSRMKSWDKAEKMYLKAMETGGTPAFHIKYIESLKNQEKLDEALEYARQADKLFPANAQVKNQLGSVLFLMQNWAEAEAVLKKAVELDEAPAGAWFNLSRALWKQGCLDDAISMAEKSVNMAPDNDNLARHLDRLLAERNGNE